MCGSPHLFCFPDAAINFQEDITKHVFLGKVLNSQALSQAGIKSFFSGIFPFKSKFMFYKLGGTSLVVHRLRICLQMQGTWM